MARSVRRFRDLLFFPVIALLACGQSRVGLIGRVVPVQSPVGSGTTLTQSNISLVGYLRAPNNVTLGADGGLSGRIVGGKVRLFLYGARTYYEQFGSVSSATNSTTFAINGVSGPATGAFAVNDTVYVVHATGTAMPQSTVIQTISGTGPYDITVSPALSATPTVGDVAWKSDDPIIEIEDPGSGYTTSLATTAQATLVNNWIDPYKGHRLSWRGGNTFLSSGDPDHYFPEGLLYNSTTGLLYSTYYESYNTDGNPDWALLGFNPDSPSTVYGPWRTHHVDGDSADWYGAFRCGFLFAHPTNGTMLCGGISRSGNVHTAWGPTAYGGAFPTTSTTGGAGASDLNFTTKYLEYYFMANTSGANYFNSDGMLHAGSVIRSFQFNKPGYSYIFESIYNTPRLSIDPNVNSSVGTWTDENSGTTGGFWYTGNRSSVIFSALFPATSTLDSSDCVNAAHVWYRNAGVGNEFCAHGCSSPLEVTGPITTASRPFLVIFDPARLTTNASGSTTDYATQASTIIDLQAAYGIITAPQTSSRAKQVHLGYYDSARKYLFLTAPLADDTIGINSRQTLIIILQITDP